MAKSRRSYKGAAVANTIGTLLTSTGTTITLGSSMSGWPTSSEPFFCVIEPGTAREEKVCVKYASSNSLTVVDPAVTSSWPSSVNGRGVDDTQGFEHAVNSVIYPVLTAREMNDANELTSAYAANGDLVVHGSTSFKKIAAGTNNYVLMADSSVSDGGMKWGQVVADSIATGAVTSAKILDGTIVLGDLATVIQQALVPVGTITAYGGASAPTGWLLCNGDTFNATTYSSLNTVLGGNTLPDLRARVPMGKAASGTGSTLLGTGGNRKVASNHLPVHVHTITHDHASQTISGGSHDHSLTGGITNNTQAATQGLYNVNGSPGFLTDLATDANSSTANMSSHGHSHTLAVATNASHDHTVNINEFTGNSGDGGFANDDYFQPFVAVNYIIKHDYV